MEQNKTLTAITTWNSVNEEKHEGIMRVRVSQAEEIEKYEDELAKNKNRSFLTTAEDKNKEEEEENKGQGGVENEGKQVEGRINGS